MSEDKDYRLGLAIGSMRVAGQMLEAWADNGDASGDDCRVLEEVIRETVKAIEPPVPVEGVPDTGLRAFFNEQRAWSYVTFGPPSFKGPRGPLDHLKKEAAEAFDEADPVKQKVEIVDCLFLVFDAAHRAGMTYDDVVRIANEKMAKNKARTWPDWRGTDPDKAIEHDRSKDPA